MSKKAFITELDDLLKPIGFVRHKATWKRRTDAVVDVIDIQVSKSADSVTVNAGVLDPDVYATLWAEAPSMFVQSPMCTVNARIGELIDGRDKWWPLDDRGSPPVVAANVAERVLPFLERLHTREAMEQWLIDTEVVEKQYPPPILSLAILKCFLGRPADGCGLLAEREQKATGPWRVRITEIAERMGCK